MSKQPEKTKSDEIVVTNQDILFDCPSCGKSLVVDVSAEGMIVDCPQCRTNVIVPPRSTTRSEPPASVARAALPKEQPKSAEEARSGATDVPAQKRLAVLAGQLKELQTQRGEVTGRIASRLNEVNRDLVMLARLETSQQQILSEWNQLVERVSPASHVDDIDASKPVVVGSSVDKGSRMRVPLGE
jgi:DNA-directed RNA polymerase subunit RPC12/RpoP